MFDRTEAPRQFAAFHAGPVWGRPTLHPKPGKASKLASLVDQHWGQEPRGNTVQKLYLIGRLSQSALIVAAMLVVAGQANMLRAQEESAGTHEEEHHGHDNAVALFLGGATHLGSDGHSNESGFALGLEYARRVASRLKIGLLAEYASIDQRKDYIFALPLFALVTEKLALVAAPGVEFATHEEGGHEEEETEFLFRFGTIYEFELDNWAIGPQIYADRVDGHWTLVYGVSLGIAF